MRVMCDTLYGKTTLKDITKKQKKTKQKKTHSKGKNTNALISCPCKFGHGQVTG